MTGRGVFVTLDGPGGVGKSTVKAAVADQLRHAGRAVYATREPTDTPLGSLARHGTDEYRGMAMACLIAADRYQHLTTGIRPALERGDVVVCDRYVASSLVLQVVDGVDRDVVWDLNRHADPPDLSVFLTAHPDVIAERLARRGAHSRYERLPESSLIEFGLYAEAATFLTDRGARVLVLDTTSTGPDGLARTIAGEIIAMQTRGSLDGRADVQPQQPLPGARGEATPLPGGASGAGARADGDGAQRGV
ncbi:dTMP kinase [Streptomyces sp. NPDC051132]|uniref:dTMP kinase n=1 Tax=unclassified Streptomyces TaxID=2593676 RepID=UPI00342DCBD5